MPPKVQDLPLIEVFQGGRWVLRKGSESQASKYSTTSERGYCWQTLQLEKNRNIASKKCGKNNPSSELHDTEISNLMKRDIHTRITPWISTTHRDFYGQRHPKVTDRRTEISLPVKESKLEDMDKLVGSVTHVPLIRMNCYADGHFSSDYERHFVDHSQFKPQKVDKDFNISLKPESRAQPYSSKKWTTCYRFDYCQLPVKANLALEQLSSTDIQPKETTRESFYQSEWSTSYQDYGSGGQRHFIETIPCREIEDCTLQMKRAKIPVTSEVGRLLKY